MLFRSFKALHWVIDWDGTMTQEDTLSVLVQIAQDAKPGENIRASWQQVTQAYLADYNAALQHLGVFQNPPTTLEQVSAHLRELTAVEQRSIDRVSASAIFRGLSAEAIDAGAAKAIATKQVVLRRDLLKFLQVIKKREKDAGHGPDTVDIVSVNWSKRFITSCLNAALPNQRAIPHINVYANELEGINEGRPSDGTLCAPGSPKIISSADKLARLQALRAQYPAHEAIVYVGDSMTDIECILAADLGICMRDTPKMNVAQQQLSDTLKLLKYELKWDITE